jgi:HK97 gp10 family phage protein
MPREFTSIAALMSALQNDMKTITQSIHAVLDHVGEEVEAAAKDKFGVYNPAIGPFPAWAQLSDDTKADRAAKGYSENEPLLRDGTLRDAIQREVHEDHVIIGVRSGPSHDGKADISDIGYWQELGTPKMPPRPFLMPALYQNQDHIIKIIGEHIIKKLER